MTVEACTGCGFVWDAVGDHELIPRVRAGTTAIGQLILHTPDLARLRPTPDRWSMLEYAGHVRDVLLSLRDRLVIGLVLDNPSFTPLFRDERVDLGLYARDEPAVVARELATAAELLVRTLQAMSAEQLDRPCQYSFPAPTERALRWLAAQVVHEVEHHLGDVREDLTLMAD